MSAIQRKPEEAEFHLQDKVTINGMPGWVRMKIHLDPKLYRVQTFAGLTEAPAEQLSLVERFEGPRVTV